MAQKVSAKALSGTLRNHALKMLHGRPLTNLVFIEIDPDQLNLAAVAMTLPIQSFCFQWCRSLQNCVKICTRDKRLALTGCCHVKFLGRASH